MTGEGITAEDYTAVRTGEKTPQEIAEEKRLLAAQARADATKTRDFLTGVTSETISVPVAAGDGGIKVIEIRARLTKRQMMPFLPIYERFNQQFRAQSVAVDIDVPEELEARFLETITVDPELDYDFWIAGDFEATLLTEIYIAFFTESVRRRAAIEKFRNQ